MNDLPEQLVQTVVGFLDKQGVSRVRQTCRSLCKSRAAWRNLAIRAWKDKDLIKSQDACVPAFVRTLHLSCSIFALHLVSIACFQNLEELSLCSARCHEEAFGKEWVFPPNLKRLTFSSCMAVDTALAHITQLPLESLRILRGTRIHTDGVRHIASLASLTRLDVKTDMAEDCLGLLQGLTGLRSLTLDSGAFAAELDLACLANLVNLEKLSLPLGHKSTDAGLVHLAHLSNLKDISLQDSFSITSIANLSRLTNLTSLNLAECLMMTDDGLACVANFANLQTLYLASCPKITSAGMVFIKDLKCLKELVLAYTSVCDQGLNSVSHITTLTDLDLSHLDEISDAGLATLINLKKLQVLDLQGCTLITEEGVKQLECLDLAFLNVNECPHVKP